MNRLYELHFSDEYVAKYLGTIPEVVAAARCGIINFSKEQEDKLKALIGTCSVWYDDSDEAQIEQLKQVRDNYVRQKIISAKFA